MSKEAITIAMQKPLPADWRWVRLGDVCEDQTGIRDPRMQPDNTFRYVDITSVDNILKQITEARILEGNNAPSRARQVIRKDDIIVSTTRPNLNAVAKVQHELDNEMCSTGFCVLRAKADILPDYLFAFVKHGAFVRALSDLVKGALYPAVTDKQVKSQILPLPPLPEQKRITAILNEQLAAVEKARAAAEAQLNTAKALSAACLRQVFPKTCQPLPPGWRWVKLVDVSLRMRNGVVALQNKEGKGIPVTRIETISDGTINPNRVGWIDEDVKSYADYQLKTGDILLSHINSVERLGNCAIYEGKPQQLIHGMNLLRIQFREDLAAPHYILFYLRSLDALKFFQENARRAIGQASLNTKDLSALMLPLPSLAEQKHIAAILNEKMAAIGVTRLAIEKQIAAINALPTAILNSAFNGEL